MREKIGGRKKRKKKKEKKQKERCFLAFQLLLTQLTKISFPRKSDYDVSNTVLMVSKDSRRKCF